MATTGAAAATKAPAEIKIGLYSITYLGYWYRGDALTPEQLVERARRLGYQGIEIEGKRPHGCPLDWPTRRCREFARYAGGQGIAICGVGALNDFSSPIAEQREAQLALVRDYIRMTAELGAGILRVFAAWPGATPLADGGARYDIAQRLWRYAHEECTDEQTWAWVRDGLTEAARMAGDHGVTLALQNHRPVIWNYKQMLQLIREAGSPHLKACLDAPILERKELDYVRQAVLETGALQAQSHFGGEYLRPAPDGPILRAAVQGRWCEPYERKGHEDMGRDFYPPFVRALHETGYRGWISYELCHPLPVADGRTVGIDFVDASAKLALEYMRGVIANSKAA